MSFTTHNRATDLWTYGLMEERRVLHTDSHISLGYDSVGFVQFVDMVLTTFDITLCVVYCLVGICSCSYFSTGWDIM